MPQKVGSLWVSGALPPLAVLCVNSWVQAGYSVTLYVYEKPTNLHQLRKEVRIEDGEKIVGGPSKIQLNDPKYSLSGFSNYFRVMMIMKTKEIWLDTDILATGQSLEQSDLVIGKERSRIVNGAVLGAKDGHPLIQRLKAAIEDKGSDKYLFGDLGPSLITSELRSLKATGLARPISDFYEIRPYENWKLFSRDHQDEISKRTEKSTFIHIWNEALGLANFNPNLFSPQADSFLFEVNSKFWAELDLPELTGRQLNAWARNSNLARVKNGVATGIPKSFLRKLRFRRGDAKSRLFDA
jgi:hypothetical protein